MHGAKQESRLADPVGKCRTVEVDTLARVDLGLTIEGQMVGILRHQHVSHRGLCRNAALDEAGGSRSLDHSLFADATGILGPTGNSTLR